MTFEELKQEFIDHGFQVDGNLFFTEMEDPNVTINGQHPMKRFEMLYVYEGALISVGSDSDSDEEEPLYQFDILGPGKRTILTVLIESFDDFTKLV